MDQGFACLRPQVLLTRRPSWGALSAVGAPAEARLLPLPPQRPAQHGLSDGGTGCVPEGGRAPSRGDHPGAQGTGGGLAPGLCSRPHSDQRVLGVMTVGPAFQRPPCPRWVAAPHTWLLTPAFDGYHPHGPGMGCGQPGVLTRWWLRLPEAVPRGQHLSGGDSGRRARQRPRQRARGRDTERRRDTQRGRDRVRPVEAASFPGSPGSTVLRGWEYSWLPPQVGASR